MAETPQPQPPEPSPGQALLFDLPLDSPRPRRRRPPAAAAPPGPAEHDSPVQRAARRRVDAAPRPAEEPRVHSGPPLAKPIARLRAAGADLLLHLALIVLVLAGLGLLRIPLSTATAPPIALFLAVFSFVYAVVPLALWGHTPGMAWVGLTARHADGRSPDFGEASRRWLGGALTLATLGLPLLAGASLADRLSGTEVIAGPPTED